MMERAWDENNIEKVRELEVAFHLALIDHCGNEFLARSRYAVQLLLRYIQEMLLSRDVEFAGAARWYSLILDKLKQGDADGVVSTVRSLIVRDRELLDQAAKRTEQDTSEVA